MFNIMKDGSVGQNIVNKNFFNAKMHFAEFVEDYIYGIDLENDGIYIFDKNLEQLYTIKTKEKSGPRHAIVFNDMIYVVTELSNQVLVYKKEKNDYKCIQEISTVCDKSVKSYAGAIKITKNKKNIYVTNRGENTISVYSIINNKLKLIQNIECNGNFPRDILLDETEEYVFIANQLSNNISIFERNTENGILNIINDADVFFEKPSCIIRSRYEI